MEVDTTTIVHPHQRTNRNETITRWNRRARAAFGVVTLGLTLLFGAIGVASILGNPVVADAGPTHFGSIQAVLFFATFTQFLLTLFYLSFVAQNPRTGSAGWWMAGMILLPWAALPLYWWRHVWNAPYVADPRVDYNVPGGEMTSDTD